MEVLLDANFIVSCIKRNIDLFEDLKNMGFKVLLPTEVFQELKDLRLNSSHEDKQAIEVALELFDIKKVKRTKLGARTVDEGLIEMGKRGAYIATLDRAIKKLVPNRVVIDNASNSLAVDRS